MSARLIFGRNGTQAVNVNDTVLIKDDKQPRSKWRMGVVDNLITSKDDNIRVVTVRTRVNDKVTYLKRPINLLCPLECVVGKQTIVC